jgi:hypothetical protein
VSKCLPAVGAIRQAAAEHAQTRSGHRGIAALTADSERAVNVIYVLYT